MPVLLWLYFGIYLIMIGLLLYAVGHCPKNYPIVKAVCSLLFLDGAGLAYVLGQQLFKERFVILMIALVLCAAGDILLAVRSEKRKDRAFMAGAISFSYAHIMFCILAYRITGFAWYDLLFPLLLAGLLYLLEAVQYVNLQKLRPLIYLYCFVIGLMFFKSLQVWQVYPGSPYSTTMVLGSALFLISDYILLYLHFGTKKREEFRYWNLATYYIGMFCLSISAFWL